MLLQLWHEPQLFVMKGGGVTTVGPSLPVMPQTMLKLPVFLDGHFKEEKTTATTLQGKDYFP